MFIVFEVQTNANGTIGTLTYTYEDRNQAESKFHDVLHSAAVSQLPKHACVLMTEEGFQLRSECYKHGTPEPTPEPIEE